MSYIQNSNLEQLTQRIYVSPTAEGADYATLKEAVDWFNANATVPTEIILDGDVHNITEKISINSAENVALNIKGLGSDVTELISDFEDTMFIIQSQVTFSRLAFNTTTSQTQTCIEIKTVSYCEFYDLKFSNFKVALKDSYNGDIFIFNFIIDYCLTGIQVDTIKTGGAIDIEVGTITRTPIGIDLKASPAKDFIINGLYYYGELATDTFININGGFGLNRISNIQNCGGNSIGSFQSGFTFSAATGIHADVEMIGNSTYESKNPHFKVNVVDGTGTTTVTTAGTYYKANFENGTEYTCKMKLEDNKYTFLPSHKKDMSVFVSGNLSTNGTNKNVTLGWKKNGEPTIYSPFTVRCATANQPYGFSFIAYFSDLSQGDYGEIFLTSSSNGDIVTIQDLNIFGMTI